MTATVQQLFSPDKDVMREFLRELFASHPEVSDGLIQFVHSDPTTGALDQHKSAWFGVDELDEAIDWLAEKNAAEGQSVYMGAALRQPDGPRFGGANDSDFYALTFAYADFDEPGDAETAVERYKEFHATPTLAVTTGRKPHRRIHLWWRLQEPILDGAEAQALNQQLAVAFGGDTRVTNPARLMRVAGSISWPKVNKPGRVTERVEFKRVSDRVYRTDDARLWSIPPCERHRNAPEYEARGHNDNHADQDVAYETHHEGLKEQRVIVDGRERWTRDLVLAKLIQYAGENGAEPTEQELYDECLPVFMDKVDQSRPGRGPNFLRAKCRSTLYRFRAGRIDGLQSIEDLVGAHQSRAHQDNEQRHEAHLDETPSDDNTQLIWFKDADTAQGSFDFVEGTLTDGAMSVVYGESNCGKTFFCTDLAMHIALGREWRGKAVEQGAVIYCALEGRAGITNRVVAFRKRHGLNGKDVPFAILPVPINLLDPKADTPRLIELIRHVKETRLKDMTVRLIVIDTLSRALSGGNENAPDDMGALVANGDRIRDETGAHIMFVHHSGKDQARGARGHSSLRAATDTEIEVQRLEGTSVSVARVTKQRDIEIEGEFAFQLESVDIGVNRRGKPITSCLVVPAEAQSVRRDYQPTRRSIAMSALKEALASGAVHPPIRGIQAGIMAVGINEWQAEFVNQYGQGDENSDSVKREFRRQKKQLIEAGHAVVRGNWVWTPGGQKADMSAGDD